MTSSENLVTRTQFLVALATSESQFRALHINFTVPHYRNILWDFLKKHKKLTSREMRRKFLQNFKITLQDLSITKDSLTHKIAQKLYFVRQFYIIEILLKGIVLGYIL